MSGELHEISAAIGRLEEMGAQASREREKLYAKLDKVDGKLNTIDALTLEVASLKAARVADRKLIDAHEDMRQKWLGAVAAISGIAGFFGLLGGFIGWLTAHWWTR